MIDFLGHFLWNNRIRKRLILSFIPMTFLMGVVSLYTYYNAHALAQNMKNMFMSNIYLNELNESIDRVHANLESYLSTKHSDSLKEYTKYSTVLKNNTREMKTGFFSSESGLLLEDIGNMIDTYLVEADAAVTAKRGRDINEYIAHYKEASKIFGYINIYIHKLKLGQFQENTREYSTITGRLSLIQLVNIFVILTAVIFNIILIIIFSFKITQPIINLAKAANEISKGNFEVGPVAVHTEDEVKILADAFNRMVSSIKSQVDAIKERAELAGRLKEQEMQNLKMKSLLKEAELKALQAQINPHFIFNTLNAGVQVAMLEQADRTSMFIENVANLFRYNMRKIDVPVTLREEINNINHYMHVLEVRFADRVRFLQQIDEGVLDTEMPCMILQPLVENAFVHGISEMETGGAILLKVAEKEGMVVIEVEDNGNGMNKEKIQEVLEEREDPGFIKGAANKRHTTGIGLKNIIRRLRIFFDMEDVVSIRSEPSKGTKVVIRLPIQGDVGK